MTGVIFNIQRFCLHDGPGIRTTVFLKGCPLRCKWCHNPESHRFLPEYWTKKTPFGDKQEQVGQYTTVAEVMETVLKDVSYYKRSGGGLTISGGEPLAQFDFCLALLQEAKQQGLHTCLETCGHTTQENLEAVLAYVDLFLYDYKATDPEKHREFTGKSNDIILDNLDFLTSKDANILLRCPLIPGVNDDNEHLAGIAHLAKRYPTLQGVEIMPYHNMGESKVEALGEESRLPGIANASEETKEKWLTALKKLGCENVRIS